MKNTDNQLTTSIPQTSLIPQNVTTDLGLDDVASSDNDTETHLDEEIIEPTIIDTYTLKLPSIKDVLDKKENSRKTKTKESQRRENMHMRY